MSTRKLIIAALLCGVAILVAGAIFIVNVSSSGIQDKVEDLRDPSTTMATTTTTRP